MEAIIAFEPNKARTMSWQEDFPLEVECVYCKGKAQLAIVNHEFHEPIIPEGGKFVSQLYPDTEGYWLHDACSVAIYFCRSCLEPTARYNQA